MSILNDIKGLFLPPVCPVCGGELHEGEGTFCMMCRTLAPRPDSGAVRTIRWPSGCATSFPSCRPRLFSGSLRAVPGSGPFMVSSITTAGARPATWVPGMAATLPTADCTEAWTVSFPCRFIPGGCWPGGTIRLLYRRGDRFPDGSAGGGSGGQSPAQQPEPDDPFFGRALGERTRLVCGRAARSVGRTARAAGR